MAKKKNIDAEPEKKNTGLILTLVFFVLATLILGTLTYFGYAEQEQLLTKAKDAEKARLDAQQQLEEARVRGGVLSVAMGIDEANDEDLRGTWSLRPNVANATYQEILTKLPSNLPQAADFNWPLLGDAPAPRPNNTLVALVRQYNDERLTALKARDDALAAQQQAEQALNQTRALAQKEKQDFDAKIQDLQLQLQQAQAAKEAAFVKLQSEYMELGNTVQDVNKQKKILEDEKDKVIRDLKRQLSDLELKLAKFEDRLQPPTVDLNVARGSVVRRQDDIVYIDLGSNHNLRPQVRFSVFPAEQAALSGSELRGPVGATGGGTPRVDLEGAPADLKGSIEVLEVIGPTLATARVIHEVNPVRNPIRPRDKLYNPAWTPGQREHIAFAGIIDLNGDGTDDTDQFIRMLEKQGVVIDAYLDLKSRTIKGKGMTLDTSYLVLAEPPNLDADLALPGSANAGDPRVEFKKEVISQMTAMRTQAKELGVQVMSARKFLAMMGIKLPANPEQPDYNAAEFIQGAADQAQPDQGGIRPIGQ